MYDCVNCSYRLKLSLMSNDVTVIFDYVSTSVFHYQIREKLRFDKNSYV